MVELQAANCQLQSLADQAEELAVTRERARLAGELHDTVGHTLVALNVQFELLLHLPPARPNSAGMLHLRRRHW
ncbi:MAG: hypothetical protein D6791_00315 [Chloroflexi bacterium]|nr:MAG: hypothetical protein D6791_00315 [Chloroflexota bacterium]